MLLSVFKILFFVAFTINAFAGFSDLSCLKEQFKTTVKHKAAPFGLDLRTLNISKEGCILKVDYTKYKFVKKEWLIDVCRAPVHIKEGYESVSVLKRASNCFPGDQSEYCQSYEEIKGILQDDGLIFAKGEKENLNSDHGRVYCTFLLVKEYLNKGTVFNKDKVYNDSFLSRGFEKLKKIVAPKKEETVDIDKTTGEYEASF